MAARELTCPGCGQSTTTNRAPGQAVACHGCGAELRVPLPERTPAREVACTACGEVQATGAAPGRQTKCKACGQRFRVPMRATDAGREVTCDACGEAFSTSAPPGKKTRCAACGAEVRVPLRDPSETRSDPRAALKDSPCPSCGHRFPLSWAACPECDYPRGAAGRRGWLAPPTALESLSFAIWMLAGLGLSLSFELPVRGSLLVLISLAVVVAALGRCVRILTGRG